MFISLIGTWIQSVAQSWLVYQLSNSTFLLGVVGFLGSIPVFFLSLFGGVLADRVEKRKILIFTQTAFMILAFVLAFLTQAKLITTAQIMLIALLNGIVMAFDTPSRQAMVAELVDKRNLFNAIALNSVAFNSSRIIGPAIAGILVASIGMSGCFYINGISFLAVIIALLVIKVNHTLKTKPGASALKDLKDGFSFVKEDRLIIILISMVGVVSLFGVSYVILMPVFASTVLNVGVKGMGILMSSSGIGALLGALFLARAGDFKRKGVFLIIASIIFSVSLILFSLSKSYALSLIALAFVGSSSVAAIALINTILQIKVPDEFRGRVMSVFILTFFGFMPFGNLIAGTLAHLFGVSFTIMLSGIVCALFFILINIFCRQIRSI